MGELNPIIKTNFMEYLDLLFKNRNKSYGAYELRKNYDKRLKLSLLSTMLFVTLICSFAFIKEDDKKENIKYNITDITLKEVSIKPEEKKEEIKQQPKPNKIKTVKYTNFKIMPDKDVTEVTPTQTEIDSSQVGKVNIDGDKYTGKVEKPEVPSNGTSDSLNVKEPEEEVIFHKVEKEASFPGGLDKWKRFLERNLNGETPVENGSGEGMFSVVIQFIVDKEGNISDITPLTSHGFGMEEEAVKVIRRGPKWIPAEQNGQKVKSYRKQVITFLVESN